MKEMNAVNITHHADTLFAYLHHLMMTKKKAGIAIREA
jgi:hypothetical protein